MKFYTRNEKFENVLSQPGESLNNLKRLNNIINITIGTEPGFNNQQ